MKITMVYLRIFFRKMPRCSYASSSQEAGYSESSKDAQQFRRAVVLTKMTRFEYLRGRYNTLSPQQLESYLRERGIEIDVLLSNHRVHKQQEERITSILVKYGFEVQVLDRYNYCEKHASWADIVFAAGGDGTFLLAASRIHDTTTPLVGFNTNPCKSEGGLCLPRELNQNLEETINKIKKGQFKWSFRSRIRIKMSGREIHQTTTGIQERDPFESQHMYFDIRSEAKFILPPLPDADAQEPPYEFPCLALNEVFISETLAARVTNLEMNINNSGVWSFKSSGLCVSTGSGSSSWHLNMNRITEHTVEDVFNIMKNDGMIESFQHKDIKRVVQQYNDSITFPQDDSRMIYSVRDMVASTVWPNPKNIAPRDFARRIEVRSQCLDGLVVVDGLVCFSFNEGVKVLLEILPEDNLRTISID